MQGYEKGIVQGSSTFGRRNNPIHWGICGSADEAVFSGENKEKPSVMDGLGECRLIGINS